MALCNSVAVEKVFGIHIANFFWTISFIILNGKGVIGNEI